MNEEQVHSQNQGDSVPPQQTQSPETKEHVFAWSVIIFVLLLIAGYFYYAFALREPDVSMPLMPEFEAEEPSESDQNNAIYLSNDEIIPDVPPSQWNVSDIEFDQSVINIAITEKYGRILSLPPYGAGLYVNKSSSCTDDCLNTWIPYEAPGEVSGSVLTASYRVDLDIYQYAWNGEPLYTYSLDTLRERYQGQGIDLEWELARP